MWHLLPFSRGSVKITDTSAFTYPQITVNYFSVDYDLAVQTAIARLSRRILNHSAFSNISAGEIMPGTDIVPDDEHSGSDEAWKSWLLSPVPDGIRPVWHEIGTASMMRRDLGGVVDGTLRVYDTTNLRVVDASVLPLQMSGHLIATIYGIAEKASDFIKSGI